MQGQPETKEALFTQAGGPNEIASIKHQGHDLLVVKKTGELWIFAESDDVLLADQSLMLVYGNSKVNQDAEKALEKPGAWRYEVKDVGQRVVASANPPPASGPFAAEQQEFGTFLKWLVDELAVVNPKMECHSLQCVFEKDPAGKVTSYDFKVAPTTICAFVPAAVPPEFRVDAKNLGSYLMLGDKSKDMWNWQDGTGRELVLVNSIHYEQSQQYTGIAPGKPSIHLKEDIKVRKHTLRQLHGSFCQ